MTFLNAILSPSRFAYFNEMDLGQSPIHSAQTLRVCMGGSRGGGQEVRTPALKNNKNIGFPSNISPDPLKSKNVQASLQWWAVIGTPAKRHFIAFHWRADDGPLLVAFESCLHPLN